MVEVTDYTQEAYASCLKNWDPSRGTDWENYFNKTVSFERKRQLEEEGRYVPLPEDEELPSRFSSPLQYAERQEKKRILRRAWKLLNPKTRGVLIDYVVNGEPLRSFGDASNSRKAIISALKELRLLLEWLGYRKEHLL